MMQTIMANMLFNKDKFQLNGTKVWFKMTAEPTIYPTRNEVWLPCTQAGRTRTLRLDNNATVTVWEEAK